MKQVARVTLVVLATLAVTALLWQLRSVVVLFLVSLALAAALRPPIEGLRARGVPLVLAMLIAYGVALGTIVVLLVAVGASLGNELEQVTDEFARSYESVMAQWPIGTPLQRLIAERLPSPTQMYEAIAGAQGLTLAEAVFGISAGFAGLISQVSLALALSVYWSIDHVRFERLWLAALKPPHRKKAREVWESIEAGVGAYVRSELTQSLLAGVLLGLGYWGMGLNYPTTLALFGAVAWLIPLVGGGLAVIPAVLAGLSESPGLALAAGVYTVGVFFVLEHVLEPRLFNRRRYSSVLVVLVMLVLAYSFGLPGLLMAPPLAAALQILVGQLLRTNGSAATAGAAPELADLQARLDQLRAEAGTVEELPLELGNMIERLGSLIEQAGSAAAGTQPGGTASQPAWPAGGARSAVGGGGSRKAGIKP